MSRLKTLLSQAPVIAFSSMVALNFYMWHRQGDMADNFIYVTRQIASVEKERHSMELRLSKEMRDQQESCKILQATVSSGKYSHTYCK